MIEGLLLLNKPRGLRSAQCVSAFRHKLPQKIKVGHGGTLDSTADGLLVLLAGAATRLSNYVMMLPKEYMVTIQLGTTTDTLDYDGTVTATYPFRHIQDKDIDRILPAFLGMRMQKPPVISAIKLNGKRASDLKRKGIEPQISPRPVTITSILRTSTISEEGQVSFFIKCHKGTYIRSIVRDLGYMLGCGAIVGELTRLKIGLLSLDQAISFEELETAAEQDIDKHIMSIGEFIRHFTVFSGDDQTENDLKNGMFISIRKLHCESRGQVPTEVVVCFTGRDLISLGVFVKKENNIFFKPQTNLFL